MDNQGENEDMLINLVDIGVGIASGGSPFPFESMNGLLRNNQNETRSILVRPNPTVPYLYLPGNTCAALAAYLPVTFLPNLGLYSWNTDSPSYQKIVDSPTYLQFVF
jgi:hypothetical protein